MASSKTKLWLIVDTKAGKVLFAEAGKDFIDFLIYLLSLPIATAVRILKEKNLNPVEGSLSHLYESLEKLPESFLQPNQDKSSLLNPRAPVYATGIPLMLSDYNFKARKLYDCSRCNYPVAEVPNLSCSNCKSEVSLVMSYVPPSPENYSLGPVEGGFLKGLATYIVMDNLEFMPMSTKMISYLLKKSDVKDLDSLEEIEVDLGVEEEKMTCTVCNVPPFTPSAGALVEVGFVKGSSVKYIVLDNLEFMPMSPEYFVTCLRSLRSMKRVVHLRRLLLILAWTRKTAQNFPAGNNTSELLIERPSYFTSKAVKVEDAKI
ncbi:hypothetical protein LWI29_023385 [Acer saccharum]|uniref:Uncharacterized protein n=1 Tax=Acer saccharum TaxID=4024 RepID=A0AA39VNP6_ACESA|nr:hypothetical protein LWI29_023385 [Acer saccharum]